VEQEQDPCDCEEGERVALREDTEAEAEGNEEPLTYGDCAVSSSTQRSSRAKLRKARQRKIASFPMRGEASTREGNVAIRPEKSVRAALFFSPEEHRPDP